MVHSYYSPTECTQPIGFPSDRIAVGRITRDLLKGVSGVWFGVGLVHIKACELAPIPPRKFALTCMLGRTPHSMQKSLDTGP